MLACFTLESIICICLVIVALVSVVFVYYDSKSHNTQKDFVIVDRVSMHLSVLPVVPSTYIRDLKHRNSSSIQTILLPIQQIRKSLWVCSVIKKTYGTV
jgi:hypothetical protein